MSSRSSYNMSMPASLPPPVDLLSYARSMHQHTKRQMEAANMPTSRRSIRSPRSHVTSLPNGTSGSSSSSRSPGEVEYHD
ncbi:uncharacterized protein F4807DRAFT_16671 [Annulohypoxylon truncatum]|uniref:uncharacterized protein n=1 Tax=Annulohypoxylon truncatum TaxID=327061 RepID=UPI002007F8FA|nr:uncharacterized protein F4807DRAFT_16671 [Annulohypoxylon truncatum]KAI1214992.1 hypothetical protein F4807DRAFT_16671 [Annulohypoxylon truncatum]